MHWRAVLVVVLAVTAGCSSFGTTDGTTRTLTPVPIPDHQQTTEPDPLPKGLEGSGVTDPRRLALSHTEALANTSYTWKDRYVAVRTVDNGSFRNEIRQEASVENDTRYRYWTNRRPADVDEPINFLGSYNEFASGDRRYAQYTDDGERVYAEFPNRLARNRIGSKATDSIRRYLAVENSSVAVTLVDGERHFEVVGTDYALPTAWKVENYTVRAIVRPDGFVRSMNVSYVRSRNDEREAVDYSFEYTDVGETTVERPAWVDDHWSLESDGARTETATAETPAGDE